MSIEGQVRLILASASPRRQALLREAGYRFVVSPADIDESDVPPGLSPAELARFLALAKGRNVAPAFPSDLILAADTVVELDGRALGKPADEGHARQMLKSLSGTTHRVVTGIALLHASRQIETSDMVSSSVSMRLLDDAEIDAYVRTRQWEGKAGGYGIQDADPFVSRISGSQSNIVGLPMERLREMLAAVSYHAAPDQD